MVLDLIKFCYVEKHQLRIILQIDYDKRLTL